MQMATRTNEYAFRKWHVVPVFASAAILRGIGRVDSHIGPTSFFRFAGELTEKGRPGCIMNAFCQTVIVGHPIDMEVFHTDDPEAVNKLTAVLWKGLRLGLKPKPPYHMV
jgi:hypothetical protein